MSTFRLSDPRNASNIATNLPRSANRGDRNGTTTTTTQAAAANTSRTKQGEIWDKVGSYDTTISKELGSKIMSMSSPSPSASANNSGETESETGPVKVHIFGSDDEEIDFAAIIIAPDGGWGWIVVLGAFYSIFATQHGWFGTALRLEQFRRSFAEEGETFTLSELLWIPSLFTGFAYLGSPLASVLINRHGSRVVAILGSMISTTALLLSFTISHLHRPSLATLYVLNGLLNGLGVSLTYISTAVIVAFYFEKHRGLAHCFAGSGVSTSYFLSPILVTSSDGWFGWKLGTVLDAALALLCAAAAALYRPVRSVPPTEDWDAQTEVEQRSDHSAAPPKHKSNNDSGFTPRHSTQSVTHEGTAVKRAEPGLAISGRSPTIHEGPAIRDQLQSGSEELGSSDESVVTTDADAGPVFRANLGHSAIEIDSWAGTRKLRLHSATKRTVNDPMSRDDIFYLGNMKRIPVYAELVKQGAISRQEWNSMISSSSCEPRQNNNNKTDGKKQHFCLKELSLISKMFSCRLFKSYTFILLTISSVLETSGVLISYLYLEEAMMTKGFKMDKVNLVRSSIGAANLVGRIICGLVADHPKVSVSALYCSSLLISGAAVAAFPFLSTFTHYILFAVVFGLTFSCYRSLLAVVQIDLVGLENFTNAFGLMRLFLGFSGLFGMPFCGMVREVTGNLNNTFYVSGVLIFVAGLVAFPLKWVSAWEMTIHGILKQ